MQSDGREAADEGEGAADAGCGGAAADRGEMGSDFEGIQSQSAVVCLLNTQFSCDWSALGACCGWDGAVSRQFSHY